MAIEKINIENFLELAKDHPVIDVRSPGEYKHAKFPGAYSLPLFTDEERKVVGTTYKQQSREAAIKVGLDYFGPKMKAMVEEAESVCSSQSAVGKEKLQTANCVLLYCWRGGMRSAGVAWLLDLYGFKVYTLTGGYKKFRNYVLDKFKESYSFNILGGYTGSGKSDIVKELKNKGALVVDLEDIAKHKGSAFGNIGMPEQPSQEMFENLLAMELRDVVSRSVVSKSLGHFNGSNNNSMTNDQMTIDPMTPPIWLEDESQRIGHINIPGDLWNQMRRSKIWFLDIPFEERLNYLVREYGSLDKQRMLDAIERISEKLGGSNAHMASALLDEGNTLESFRILLKYYDKYYLKALHNRESLNSLLHTVECKSVTPENANLLPQHTYQKAESV